MVSYADMITIIMAFFVVLYATTSGPGASDKGHADSKNPPQNAGQINPTGGGGMTDSEAEDAKMRKVIRSLYDRFGPNWTLANCWTGGPASMRGKIPAELKAEKEDKKARTLTTGKANSDSSVALKVTKTGEYTVPGGRIFFPEFSADLSNKQKSEMFFVAQALAGKLQKIELRGHTSRRPLPKDSVYRDHIDLAYARCRAVRDYLIEHGVDPQRMRIALAAENEPLDMPVDAALGEKNSRVEIRLLNEWIEDPQNAAPSLPPGMKPLIPLRK